MSFDELLERWTEAEMQVVSYGLCHPLRSRPEVEFLAAQLKAAADRWYCELISEVARLRRELPRI